MKVLANTFSRDSAQTEVTQVTQLELKRVSEVFAFVTF